VLKNKVVIVSGVGPGLGQALARIAAQEGAKVVLAARSGDYLETVRGEIVAAGGAAIAVPCDVSRSGDCGALAQSAAEAFGGRIDGLVNSAYIYGVWTGVAEDDEAEWAKIYDVNCLGALRVTKACVPYMKPGSAVVNVSTQASVRAAGGEHGMEMGYAAAKGALNVLGKYMATDLGKHGIRVNTCRMGWIGGATVAGYIDSQVASGRTREEVVGEVTKDIPLGIIPPEDDCARGVLMLLSDYAAVVTGAALDINGGHWMAP